MILSKYIGGNVPDYIEFAWVTAPNDTPQTVPANVITRLNLNTLVADTGNVIINPSNNPSNNQFALPAGTYYYSARCSAWVSGNSRIPFFTLSLNKADGTYISRSGPTSSPSGNAGTGGHAEMAYVDLTGQFIINSDTTFELRLLCGQHAMSVSNFASQANSTAGADQRTTIKLWKLA